MFSRSLAVQFSKKQNFNVGLHSDSHGVVSFKLDMMIDTTTLYSVDTSLNDLGLHSRSRSDEEAGTSALIFSHISRLISMNLFMLP